MSNYNSQLQSNNLDLQEVLQTLQTKATAGQVTPEISVSSNGLITATAGTKTSTHQLAFQPAKTITPSTTSQIAVSSGYYTGGDVMVAGDANLIAGNIKSGVSIFGVSGTLQEGSGSGEAAEWSENEDAIISGTISSYTNDRVTAIGSYAFNYCSRLTTVSFPQATTIGSSAFAQCSHLTTVSFPAATTIGPYAFVGCRSLTTVSFPQVTTIGHYAFASCRSITTANFPAATAIGSNAFQNCASLTTVNFPAVAIIDPYAFQNCNSLTIISFPQVTSLKTGAFGYCYSLITVDFPVATTIESNAFRACNSLTTVSFPQVTVIKSNAFQNCNSLTTISFPAATAIGSSAFQHCYNLKSLYLTGSSLCKLSNSNAFSSTPIGGYSASAGTYGSIYVPASLLTSYQTATNWAYFSSRFVAYDGGANIITFTIEGTEYQAEEGMTWAEWVESEYNTDNYYINNGKIDNGYGQVTDSYSAVLGSAIINQNYSYGLVVRPPIL